MRALRSALVAVAALSLALVPGAMSPAAASTITMHNATDTFHDEVPCVGLGNITIVFNSVEHVSANPGGGFHETDTSTGTFTTVLDSGGTSSGHFTVWDNFNTANGVTGEGSFTFNGHVDSGVSAGTHWHENAHFAGSLDPSVPPKVAFDKSHCT